MKRRGWSGFSKIVGKDEINAKCMVIAEGEKRKFDEFVLVGFSYGDGNASGNTMMVTTTDIVDLHRAITLLVEAYDKALDEMGPEVRRILETERAIEDAQMMEDDEDEDEDDDDDFF